MYIRWYTFKKKQEIKLKTVKQLRHSSDWGIGDACKNRQLAYAQLCIRTQKQTRALASYLDFTSCVGIAQFQRHSLSTRRTLGTLQKHESSQIYVWTLSPMTKMKLLGRPGSLAIATCHRRKCAYFRELLFFALKNNAHAAYRYVTSNKTRTRFN